MKSKEVNSGADTARSISSSQHQRERQTNTIKQPQKEKMANRFGTLLLNLGEHIFKIHNCRTTMKVTLGTVSNELWDT